MRYSEKDIDRIPITEFMKAIGEKPAMVNGRFVVYHTPYRDDPEPLFWVDAGTNRWHDYATDESGNLRDLASLNMNPHVYKDPVEYILKMMNEYELGKEMSAMARHSQEPVVIGLTIKDVRLTDFMKALGQERPVAADGNLRIYNAPYDPKVEPTMVVNTETNLWRDTKSGAYGGIYDLAYELTGSCNMSELNRYITMQIKGIKDFKTYGVTANGKEADGNVVVAIPVSKPEPPQAKIKIEPLPSDVKIDINNIPIVDFMKAIGFEPLKHDGNLLMFDCPYAFSKPIRTVVDTEKNYWYDTEDDCFCGDIYRLAAEITYKESRAELTRYIATQMKNLERYKSCRFTDKYERPGAKVLVVGFTISDPGLPKQSPKEQYKQQPSKPKRKMRF